MMARHAKAKCATVEYLKENDAEEQGTRVEEQGCARRGRDHGQRDAVQCAGLLEDTGRDLRLSRGRGPQRRPFIHPERIEDRGARRIHAGDWERAGLLGNAMEKLR